MRKSHAHIRRHTTTLQRKCDQLRVAYEDMPTPITSHDKRRRTTTARRYADACQKLAQHVSRHADQYV